MRMPVLGVAALAAAAVLPGVSPSASSQVTVAGQAQVKVTVNIPGQLPPGVTRYRAELRCLNIRGIAAPGSQNLTEFVDRLGGTAAFVIQTQAGTNCRFRLAVEGSGPRPITGTAMFVGGSARQIFTLTSVDGQPVDPDTVLESIDVPIEASTDAIWGSVPVTTIPTTTAPAPTLPATTTTTTRPPVTVPPVTVPPAPAPTAAPPTAPPVRLKIVRTTRCRTRYRFVEIATNRVVRCLTTAEVKKYVQR
jgi:hypothetical protein